MSNADTIGGDGPEMVQINLRLSNAFLEDIDATWEDQGFNSRSEFLRYAARDAVKHPEFSPRSVSNPRGRTQDASPHPGQHSGETRFGS